LALETVDSFGRPACAIVVDGQAPMTRLPESVQYCPLLFVPLLVPLLPASCLGLQYLLLVPILLSDPLALDPGDHAAFCAWALGPLPAAAVIFALGLLAHKLAGVACPSRGRRAAVWATFSLAAFPVAWYLIILVTSFGATEPPPEKYLGVTALMTLAAILLQLSLVDRFWETRRTRLWPVEVHGNPPRLLESHPPSKTDSAQGRNPALRRLACA
jgi:peptidoglycan/LPS O-acetylase OafA/YrhL